MGTKSHLKGTKIFLPPPEFHSASGEEQTRGGVGRKRNEKHLIIENKKILNLYMKYIFNSVEKKIFVNLFNYLNV